MLRKTVTAPHGAGDEAAAKAGTNDTAALAKATASAYGALNDLEAAQQAEDEARAARAKANARTGFKVFRGCSC